MTLKSGEKNWTLLGGNLHGRRFFLGLLLVVFGVLRRYTVEVSIMASRCENHKNLKWIVKFGEPITRHFYRRPRDIPVRFALLQPRLAQTSNLIVYVRLILVGECLCEMLHRKPGVYSENLGSLSPGLLLAAQGNIRDG